MSTIFKGDKTAEQTFNASQLMDTARRKVIQSGDMVFVKLEVGVTGNAKGTIKTGNNNSGKSTGGSFLSLFGSDYCTADLSIPFSYEYGKTNMKKIAHKISQLQTKFSQHLTAIQGKLDPDLEKALRESALVSRAIREAKQEIQELYEASVFNQNDFNQANMAFRAKVISDMSLKLGISCNAALDAQGDLGTWGKTKGYKESKTDSTIITSRADEKGLKKIYLVSAEKVSEAQDWVYNYGKNVQSIVEKSLSNGWSDLISNQILDAVEESVSGTKDGNIKEIPDFTGDELEKLGKIKLQIVDKYKELVTSFS